VSSRSRRFQGNQRRRRLAAACRRRQKAAWRRYEEARELRCAVVDVEVNGPLVALHVVGNALVGLEVVPSGEEVFALGELPVVPGGIAVEPQNSWPAISMAMERWLAGGWQISSIYTRSSGTPVAIVWSGCSGTTNPG
jgi:hypothetical protein